MRTYKQVFDSLDRPALVPFFVIGDPDFDRSLEIVKAAIDSGADVIELGIPFSDPIADGTVIQAADIRALENGMTTDRAMEFIKEIKKYKDIPIGLLMYYNLVYQYGIEKFFVDFYKAGVNSVLVADLNIDDADEILPAVKASGMDSVFMVTPNTQEQRAKLIAEKTTGFIYTVAVLGVTGARNELSDAVRPLISKLKSITDVPVCVGFGISSPQHAKQVADAGADGVIIGSKIVKFIESNLDNQKQAVAEISDFIESVKAIL